jgi:hypothetical protein
MYVLARIVVVRRLVGWAARAHAPEVRIESQTRSMFDADVPAIVRAVRRDGFDSRLRLPPDFVRELAASGEPFREMVPFSLEMAPLPAAVGRIESDPLLLRLAALYFQSRPVVAGSRIWWTRAGAADADPLATGSRFHYDLYDYRTLVVLFYLTDVPKDGATHVCVRASHRARRWRDQLHPRRHRSDEIVRRLYGGDRIVEIVGQAGTGIAEDPYCFHNVKLPTSHDRLALQILYTGREVSTPSFRRSHSEGWRAASR